MTTAPEPPAPTEPLLTVRHLTATYSTNEGPVPAVRDISFDLYPREVLALVGESAAGKSTVAHAILNLLPQQTTVHGDIRYLDIDLTHTDPEAMRQIASRHIAMIFQEPLAALTPTLSIGEQVDELFTVHRHFTKNEAIAAAYRTLGAVLPDPARIVESYTHQLSGGMAQHVMIAMATALGPDIIIADEATSNLDPGTRQETISRIEGMRDDGTGVLLITHDFGVVARLADRVAVMYAGAIVETGDVSTIFAAPATPIPSACSKASQASTAASGSPPCGDSRPTSPRLAPNVPSSPAAPRPPRSAAPILPPSSSPPTPASRATPSPATTPSPSTAARPARTKPCCSRGLH